MEDPCLPSLDETLATHGIKRKNLEVALDDYYDLSCEVLYQQDPHRAPYAFLAASDRHEVLKAFMLYLRTS